MSKMERTKITDEEIQRLYDIANRLRIDSIKATESSKSGHPTSCSSSAEIISVLFFYSMDYSATRAKCPSNDRFVLSKGHAAPILYAAWAEIGRFPVSELLSLRKIDSFLEGHPTPRLDFIDVATGSLGQGFSVACGMAYVGKRFDGASYRVYCLIGDGELAEGSNWEAFNFASYYKLDNLVAILDINRLGQSQATSLEHNMEIYQKRLDAFGFHAIIVDGHNVLELVNAFEEARRTKDKPTAVICKTLKGKNFPGIEDQENWHGRPLLEKANETIAHLESLIKNKGPIVHNPLRYLMDDCIQYNKIPPNLDEEPPNYKEGEMVATRVAYGTALLKIVKSQEKVIALDGDTKNSTFANALKDEYAVNFIECFIAEQNLVGVAIGAACRGRRIPFVSTFAAFFTRAYDQIRMGAISQANIKCVGSHCGISIGEDGASQMALEDIAMFRTIPGSTIFYPSDAVSAERAVELAANTEGICFIRTSRPNFPILYKNDEHFQVGKHKIVKKTAKDECLIVSAGVTLHEAIAAHNDLMINSGINIRIIDLFTIKPLDSYFICENAVDCNGKIIVVEDHYPQGGIGEAVMAAVQAQREDFSVVHLAVNRIPRSGPSQALLKMFGIDREAIRKTVIEVIERD